MVEGDQDLRDQEPVTGGADLAAVMLLDLPGDGRVVLPEEILPAAAPSSDARSVEPTMSVKRRVAR
jgi:hypothetical protein